MKQVEKSCLLCSRPAFSRNLCKLCYMKNYQAGTLDKFKRVVPQMSIESRVKKTRTCWIWTGDRNDFGYGIVTLAMKPIRIRVRAHRWVYEQLVGAIPKGKHILHSCDNPRCVNPKHLRIGTIADNNRDTAIRRRHHYGLEHWNGRLTDEQIEAIRKSDKTQVELGKEYGINQSYVCQIKNRLRRT